MPRPRRPGAPAPKRRSRNGCWPCKARKVKCGEEKPSCFNCRRQDGKCDYSLKLHWEGRPKRRESSGYSSPSSGVYSIDPFPMSEQGLGCAGSPASQTQLFSSQLPTQSPLPNQSYPSPSRTEPDLKCNHGRGFYSEQKWHAYLSTATDNYGLDRGYVDMDLNKNNDYAALDVSRDPEMATPLQTPEGNFDCSLLNDGSSQSAQYTYYACAVPVNIPRYLSPLPMTLWKNPINLMYFHHFINHTARMLVPHDCENNPFSSVLPSMAIADPNLLNLTLAYSASHRARYLGHEEPANRIANWVSDVFPTLRLALEDPRAGITDGHLATAIMLLSLKIISPNTFEVPIPWQNHLSLARDLFREHVKHMVYPGNRIGMFLAQWLGYIDIMGTLSCRDSEPPLDTYFTVIEACSRREDYDELFVDCFTGFSPRTGSLLIRLGKLVHQCDNERFCEDGTFQLDWSPTLDVILEAKVLIAELEIPKIQTRSSNEFHQGYNTTELAAIDQAFCCSALLHLQRRVLGESLSSNTVHEVMCKLTEALAQIEPGGSAEVGVLYPLFTAGCEAQDISQRLEVLERLMAMEKTGMKQIQNARRLMQQCWSEGLPWIALAHGEFLG